MCQDMEKVTRRPMAASTRHDPNSSGLSEVWLDWMYREPAADATRAVDDASGHDADAPRHPAWPLAS